MPSAYLKAKMTERAGLSDAMTGVLDKCAADAVDPTPEQRAQLDTWGQKIQTLDSEILQLRTQLEANDRFVDVISAVDRADENQERRAARTARTGDGDVPEERKSYGQRFIESDSFKNYRGRGTMEPVEFDGFLEKRAAITTDTLDLPPVIWDGPRGYVSTTPLLDVIGREVVSSGSVEFITWTNPPSEAQVVPEGGLKPEADITPTTTPLVLETYAHWKAITRQALEDYARIQSIVQDKLRAGLAAALERAAGEVIQAAAWETATGDTFAGAIRNAIAVVQGATYQPNAVLLNPADFARLDIESSYAGNNGPQSYGTFWGVRPIAVSSLPAGTAYVGDFAEAVTWFDRNTASVYMSDSHADYFIRNLLVVLAEQRSAFAATELAAAVKVAVPAAPAPEVATAAKSTK